jgi:predicted RNA binding protein YcfA (HicA-like mRNA interferase family)
MGLAEFKRIQRLLAAVRSTRNNCRFEDIEKLLLAIGFVERKTKGSHTIFKRESVTISVPRRKPVKEVYVDEVLALIASLL